MPLVPGVSVMNSGLVHSVVGIPFSPVSLSFCLFVSLSLVNVCMYLTVCLYVHISLNLSHIHKHISHIHMDTYIHTYIHTRTYTYIYTYIHTLPVYLSCINKYSIIIINVCM